MKKPSPMQMRAAKSGNKRMESYAAKRNASMTKKSSPSGLVPVAAQMGRDNYDAQYDLDTLTRAAAIKADAKRHSAAMNEAKKKQAALQHVMTKA